jgi:dihydroorotase-like cyclic amidohydrolase
MLVARIDLHTHLREPGTEQKGTIATETLPCGVFHRLRDAEHNPRTRFRDHGGGMIERTLATPACSHRLRHLQPRCKQLAELSNLRPLAACLRDDGSPVADGFMRNALELAGALGLPRACDDLLNHGGVMNERRRAPGPRGPTASGEVTPSPQHRALRTTGARLHRPRHHRSRPGTGG